MNNKLRQIIVGLSLSFIICDFININRSIYNELNNKNYSLDYGRNITSYKYKKIFDKNDTFIYYNENQLNIENRLNNLNTNFGALLNVIQILIFKYFEVFQTCYLRSINIIYYLVGDYFIVFNHLFFESFLSFLELCKVGIVSNYEFLNNFINLLFIFPNNVLLAFIITLKILLENQINVNEQNNQNNQNNE